MNLQSYLERIGYSGDPAPTLETLQAMHRAHFYSVPFENLDIGRGVRIEVDEQVIFDKIVRRKRGVFCLELNALFAVALRALGFSVDVIGDCRASSERGRVSACVSSCIVGLERNSEAGVLHERRPHL